VRESLNLIWFKRDLRWQDHAPLKAAIEAGQPLLGLFIFEDFYPKDPSWSLRHWQAQFHSLLDMKRSQPSSFENILVLQGNAETILQHLSQASPLQGVYSYQETGEHLSYERDKALTGLFTTEDIHWYEFENNAVQRGLKSRSDWNENWQEHMDKPLDDANLESWVSVKAELLIELKQKFGISPRLQKQLKAWPQQFQMLGESLGHERVKRFLQQKIYKDYGAKIGQPYESRFSCSRLSPFLAWGNLSLRQVYQAGKTEHECSTYPRDLNSFITRLHWHSHFVQKFEMQEYMEFENLNPAFNSLHKEKNPQLVLAWKNGKTGYPLVDACIRAVCETGYLNFRMRAMVVSFLCHHLWQDWQEGAHFLAQQFLDYLPGIHYPQFQMQNGSTGINTIRVYNPVKQSLEKDVEAKFICEWLPELKNLPLAFKHQPWLITPMEETLYNFNYGKDYPKRIIDIVESGTRARDTLWAFRKTEAVKTQNRKILLKF
jgi:deoxyribodipyrimidine photo-lyase